ncbi:CvpA family protein [Campylobacter sputorum]|uniref:CvpA family protein n=1 Tax=Campylobacter sputorum TaxID=206 RepID=UPI000B78AF43|nr:MULTISPECIES: CvpA family protein [Campylobacter]ASM39868.1 putative membrane protein, CvpA family [Campylobacter sputorum]MBE7357518.1 CvpA family protein [Campylobacter sp. RM11302]MBF6674343.1 CvpA family protein [Campylobacter sp. RM13538]MBF6675384.1 CvpA family protein [Campylobacter sp. RM12321]MBF6677028.1 CvpA family protein [Campylobacter sp. RM11259]
MSVVNWFDAIILGIIILVGIKGAINGLIKEIFGLIGIIGGLIFATRFDGAQELISTYLYQTDNKQMLSFIAFIASFIVFWLACLIIGNILTKFIRVSALGFFDRLGGLVFGCAKVFLIFSVIFVVITNIYVLNLKIEPILRGSVVYETMLECGKWIMNINIDKIKDDLNIKIQNLDDQNLTLDDNISLYYDQNLTKEK